MSSRGRIGSFSQREVIRFRLEKSVCYCKHITLAKTHIPAGQLDSLLRYSENGYWFRASISEEIFKQGQRSIT